MNTAAIASRGILSSNWNATSILIGSTSSCNTNFAKTIFRTMATKKAGGSSSNGRDSAGRRLGIKIWPNQYAKAGSILVRQRGQKFRAGENVGMGKDHTIYAKAAGIVRMSRLATNKKRNVVHVTPC